MMRAGFIIGLLLTIAGCPASPPGNGVDASDRGDGGSDGASLLVTLRADIDTSAVKEPSQPRQATLIAMSRISLELQDVRVIGDAAPGDDRTTIAGVSFDWQTSDVECLVFNGVPPGIYSRLLARVVWYRLEGAIEDGGTEFSFRIEDAPPSPLSLMVDTVDVLIDVEQHGEVGIELDVMRAIDAVDWDAYQPDGNDHIDVDADSPSIDDVRDAMSGLLQPGDDAHPEDCPG